MDITKFPDGKIEVGSSASRLNFFGFKAYAAISVANKHKLSKTEIPNFIDQENRLSNVHDMTVPPVYQLIALS